MKIKRSPQAAWRKIDGDIIVVTPRDGILHRLVSETSAFIWELLESTPEETEIPAAVCAEFEIDPETARTDTEAFIAEMIKKNLIEKVQ